MSAIGDAMAAVVAAIADAGLSVTDTPDLLLPKVQESGYCILVEPPDITAGLLSGTLTLQVACRLAVRPPGGLADYQVAWAALEALPRILGAPDATREPVSIGEQTLPGYLITVKVRATP